MTNYNPNLIEHLKKLVEVAKPGEQLGVYVNTHYPMDKHSELAIILSEDGAHFRTVYATGIVGEYNFSTEYLTASESIRALTDEELEKVGFDLGVMVKGAQILDIRKLGEDDRVYVESSNADVASGVRKVAYVDHWYNEYRLDGDSSYRSLSPVSEVKLYEAFPQKEFTLGSEVDLQVGATYQIVVKSGSGSGFNLRDQPEHLVEKFDRLYFYVKGSTMPWSRDLWKFRLIEAAAPAKDEQVFDLEVGKSYRIERTQDSFWRHPEGVFKITEVTERTFGTDAQGPGWMRDFYKFFPVDEQEEQDGLVEVASADLLNGATYTIKHRPEAVRDYGAACLHPEGEFAVRHVLSRPDNFYSSHPAGGGNGWQRKLYRFFKKAERKLTDVSQLVVGKKYRFVSTGSGMLTDGIYTILELRDPAIFTDTFRTDGAWSNGWRKFDFYDIFELDEESAEPEVEKELEEDTYTQEQVDEFVTLKVAKAVEQERKNLYGVLEALGVNTDDIDTVIAAAKAARLAYWETIGEPRKSEPKEISLKGWVAALMVGNKAAEVDKEC